MTKLGLHSTRRKLANGSTREYFYNRETRESLGSDRAIAEARMLEFQIERKSGRPRGGVVNGAGRAELADNNGTSLTGRGGEALVAYHLARLGIDFVPTVGASPHGDIWAINADGRFGIEVKTTRGRSWRVRVSQMRTADFYIFVQLDSSACYVLTTAEVRVKIEDRESTLDRDDVRDGLNAWSKLRRNDFP